MWYLIRQLQSFPLTKRIKLRDRVQEPERDLTYLQVSLQGDYSLYIRELYTPSKKFYSYHLQDKGENMVFRYDNAHDYKDIPTSPHHKHVKAGRKAQVLEDPSLEGFLNEVKKIVST